MTDARIASTGRPGLDQVLDSLRMGDNVVWQVDSIADYMHFAVPFADAALSEGRRVVYMRFGRHARVLTDDPRIITFEIDPSRGFESFSTEVREIVSEQGRETFYVFDSLSELLTDWATDLMVGNFFVVTCPYLFELDTIAYFALLRDRHSFQTVARIRDTTQLLIDVYNRSGRHYVHPLKAWRRYSPTMFLPHVEKGCEYQPLTSSADAAELFASFPLRGLSNAGRMLDTWDLTFLDAAELLRRLEQRDPSAVLLQAEAVRQLSRLVISRDERMLELACRHLRLQDLLQIKSRMIGTGLIGGKAVGLILSRKMLENGDPGEWGSVLEPHDSFYVGSDVYYTYLVENGCWTLKQKQRDPESYYAAADELRQRLLEGVFPDQIRAQFREMLDYFGQSPLIVRSSSLLEDGFGNAFAGKYESVFCPNQGSPTERYEAFERAVRTVYASTMSRDALAYRQQRGLAQSDEQMALLIQRVSGSRRGDIFMPDVSGVAMSYNPYVWRRDMDARAGMARLVVGLGTRAVNRVEDDYARLVALDRPDLTPGGKADALSHSQRKADLLDLGANALKSVDFNDLVASGIIPDPGLVAERDPEASRRMADLGIGSGTYWVVSMSGLISSTPIIQTLRKMLATLTSGYRYHVDTEFTINFVGKDEFRLNLLQCRPLQTGGGPVGTKIPKGLRKADTLFSVDRDFIGGGVSKRIDRVVYVKEAEYSRLSQSDKYRVARLIGKLNSLIVRAEADASSSTLLLGPGRWGTSTPSLGIPVSFAEINNYAALGEIAFETAGYVPEISYGTHFFQDIVETGMFYVAIFPQRDGSAFEPARLLRLQNRLSALIPEDSDLQSIVHVAEVGGEAEGLWLVSDVEALKAVCFWGRLQQSNRPRQ